MDTVRDTVVVAEFAGEFPQVPVSGQVNMEALTVGDPDPFFVTIPIAEAGAVSANNRLYDAAFVQDLARQVMEQAPTGQMGHLAPGERDHAYPLPAVHWVGATQQGQTLWGKGYVPPGAVRDHIRRLKSTNGKLATSIYGTATTEPDPPSGALRVKGFRLESIDFAPPARAGVPTLAAVPVVTAEMEESQEGDMPEPTATALVAELQTTLASQQEVIAELQAAHTTHSSIIGELRTALEDSQAVIAELRASRFERDLSDLIAEKVKVKALQPAAQRVVVQELAGQRDLAQAQTALETWLGSAEYKALVEPLIRHAAGPNVLVGEFARHAVNALTDTPEARANARSGLGF